MTQESLCVQDFMRRYGIEPLVPLERDAAAIAGEKSVTKERAKVRARRGVGTDAGSHSPVVNHILGFKNLSFLLFWEGKCVFLGCVGSRLTQLINALSINSNGVWCRGVGLQVKEACPQCGNDEMEYYTMQVR